MKNTITLDYSLFIPNEWIKLETIINLVKHRYNVEDEGVVGEGTIKWESKEDVYLTVDVNGDLSIEYNFARDGRGDFDCDRLEIPVRFVNYLFN